MEKLKYEIIPYSKTYEASLLALEKEATQGKFVQLEMIRDCFKTRSSTFDKSQIFLAIDMEGKLLGVLAAAIVTLVINGEKNNVGYCFDVRVAKNARGHGLTKKMGQHAYKHFYLPNQAAKVFLTMKKNNYAVHKSAKILGLQLYKYPFSYLTIPTSKRLEQEHLPETKETFTVKVTDSDTNLNKYLYDFHNETKVWRTNLIYTLKIKKLHVFIKFLKPFLNYFRRGKFQLPTEGEELIFSTLIYSKTPSADEINTILEFLQHHNVGYLLVACNKNSNLFKLMKPILINRYIYEICSTFPINENDSIVFDVRCL